MKRSKRLKNLGAICVIVIAVLSLLVLANCIIMMQVYSPEPTVLQTAPSPDGDYVAYVFESNPGATSGFVYRLSILKSGKKLGKGNGNAYISDAAFTVEWTDDQVLNVNHDPTAKFTNRRRK